MSTLNVNDAEQSAAISAALGHDPDEVIADLVKSYGLTHEKAVEITTRQYVAREQLDDEDAADAEFDTE